jgi:hypothetical protein
MKEYYRYKIINGRCLAQSPSEFSAFMCARERRGVKRCVLNYNELQLVIDKAVKSSY